eukprot:1145598-Pleurochrysis_carterae.AAC.1
MRSTYARAPTQAPFASYARAAHRFAKHWLALKQNDTITASRPRNIIAPSRFRTSMLAPSPYCPRAIESLRTNVIVSSHHFTIGPFRPHTLTPSHQHSVIAR